MLLSPLVDVLWCLIVYSFFPFSQLLWSQVLFLLVSCAFVFILLWKQNSRTGAHRSPSVFVTCSPRCFHCHCSPACCCECLVGNVCKRSSSSSWRWRRLKQPARRALLKVQCSLLVSLIFSKIALYTFVTWSPKWKKDFTLLPDFDSSQATVVFVSWIIATSVVGVSFFVTRYGRCSCFSCLYMNVSIGCCGELLMSVHRVWWWCVSECVSVWFLYIFMFSCVNVCLFACFFLQIFNDC